MTHRTRTAAALAIVFLALAFIAPATASASTPKSTATYSWSTPSVRRGTLNDTLITRINALGRLPGGPTKQTAALDLLLYSANRPDMVNAVLSAADRGVKVRLLTSHAKPDGEDEGVPLWGEMNRLINGDKHTRGLKGRRNAVVKVGWGSLSADKKHYIEHRKLVLIRDDRGRKSTLSDSGNWVWATDATADNDRFEIVDACMYDGERKHFDVLQKDRRIKTTKGAVVSTCDKTRRLYNLPEAHVDPVIAWASKAKCGRGAVVQFGNFYFTGSRSKLTDALIRFKKGGATVQVAANDRKWSKPQGRRMVAAGIVVVDVNGAHDYNHRKSFSATGCAGGPFGAQGSATMNRTAVEKNGNAVVTTTVAADVHAMQAGFVSMTRGRPAWRP